MMESQQPESHPIRQFGAWIAEAKERSGLEFPNAACLATVNAAGQPSARMVLLKDHSEKGFVFFSNYESRKATDLMQNSRAALCFYWEKLNKSVRVEGVVEKTSREVSQAYFSGRPRAKQIGAWASPQSREIESRSFLEKRVQAIEEKFRSQEEISVPDHWGGYCLVPETIEFWIDGANRLHDRYVYKKTANGEWKKTRLAP